MSKLRSLLVAATVIGGAFGTFGAQAACDANKATAAGSRKNCAGNISCGTTGQLAEVPAGDGTAIRSYANQTNEGAEVEACNATGTGTTHGRLVLQVRTDKPGVRLSLDTDDETPQFPGGYINVQVAQEGAGVWCNQQNEGPNGAANIDAYEQPWNKPGTDGGLNEKAVNCAPGN